MACATSAQFNLRFPTDPKFDPRKTWTAIEPFTDIAVVDVNPEVGLQIQCIDRTRSSVITWSVSPDRFTVFNVDDTYQFGIIILEMCKALRCADAGATIDWSFDIDRTQPLRIQITPSATKTNLFEATFDMSILDVESDIFSMPSLHWCRVRVSTERMKNAIVQLHGLSTDVSHIYIYLKSPNQLTFRVEAQHTTGTLHIDTLSEITCIDKDNNKISMETSNKHVTTAMSNRLGYQITLLHKVFDSAVHFSPDVLIHWSEDSPLYLRFVGKSENDTIAGNIHLCVASRLDDTI